LTLEIFNHINPLFRLPKISEIAAVSCYSAAAADEESSPKNNSPMRSASSSSVPEKRRVVEIVDAAAFQKDKERRAERGRKLLEAFDD
jgi:hypothetical protein